MTMELIRNWYNGTRDFAIGVSLFETLGGSPDLVALLKKGATIFAIEKLEQALLQIYRGQAPVQETASSPTVAPYEGPGEKAPADPVLRELYLRKVALHKEKDHLRSRLEQFPNDQERGAAAHRILKIRDEITGIWQTEDYYRQHQRLPTNVSGVTDPGMLMHRRTIVNGNIRRLRALLKKDPDNTGHQKSMAKFAAEYAVLKAQIKKYREHGKTAR